AVTRESLLPLARMEEKSDRWGATAAAYRRVLAATQDAGERAAALVGLARAYERQHCWAAARATWTRLAREHGDRTVAELDPKRPVREAAEEHLKTLPDPSAAKPEEDLGLPWRRSWEVALDPGEHALPAVGCPDWFFLARGTDLVCRDAGSG